jgi:hypothetical protein
MRRWEVYRFGNHIATVEYEHWRDAAGVRAALVRERAYPSGIIVALV